jgi:hypothetical protein
MKSYKTHSLFRIEYLLFSFLMILQISCSQENEEIPQYGWFDFVVTDLDTTKNAIDLSFLNENVAGENGFVTVQDGHFVDGSGKKIRFFGTNLTFSSAFPDKETSTKIAARLSKMGMNVVRFHHLDMRATPNGIWDSTMLQFDANQVDKLDWLIYQLKQHGIYSNINLHVSRTYPGLESDVPQFRFDKSIDHFYRPYIELQKAYALNLLTHQNPYTGTTYTDEPAVAFIELNNENSLLSNWKHLPLLKGEHRHSLQNQWKIWLKSNAGGNTDLFKIIEEYDEKSSDAEKALLWRFLVDTEMAYTKEMSTYVRNDLQAKPLVADSQASYSGIAGIHREAKYSDFIDMHAYWEHPSFPGESWSRTNWLIRNSSMVSDKKAGTLARFSQHRVAGMPLTISEYDHPAPNFFVAEMYPMLNAVAAFQDWDGIYHFTFNGAYNQERITGFFSSAGHPLKQIFIPIGSIIFRTDAVKTGTHTVKLQLPETKVIDELVESGDRLRLHGSNMDYIWEKAGAPKALPILNRYEVSLLGDEVKLSEEIPEPEGAWVSETNEIIWHNTDSASSFFTINTDAVKAAVGYIGAKQTTLGNISIEMDSTEFNWAAIVLASMDGNPIDNSSSMVLAAAGRVENTNMGWNDHKTTVGGNWGDSPSRAEGIPAIIRLDGMEKFKVFILDPNGNIGNEVNVHKKGAQQSFTIGAQHKTLWYLLKRE